MSMKPQLLTGARGELSIAGKTVAYVTDVSISLSHNVRPIHTFGAPNARSVEPLSVSPVSVSVGRVVPVNSASDNSETGAKNTSAIQMGAEPALQNILTADDVTIILKDKLTDKVVATVMNCRFSGRSLSVSAGQIATERLQFMGIYDAGQSSENTANKIGV